MFYSETKYKDIDYVKYIQVLPESGSDKDNL